MSKMNLSKIVQAYSIYESGDVFCNLGLFWILTTFFAHKVLWLSTLPENSTTLINTENFNDANHLFLELEQKNHLFPFGTAVRSQFIADCLDADFNDGYCSFVNENYNWMVDNFR